MNGKDSFILYKSFYEPISQLNDEQLGRLFRAIFKWQLSDGKEPIQIESDINIAFGFFIHQFKYDDEKYQAKCESNRQNGLLGGRPKKPNGLEKTERLLENPTKAKKADNENDNDNEVVKSNTRRKLSLPFSSTEFIAVWEELKSQPKWKHKTISAQQRSLDKLSSFDELFAIEVMKTAIANDTKGLVYDSTIRQYEQWKHSRSNGSNGKVITSIEDL